LISALSSLQFLLRCFTAFLSHKYSEMVSDTFY
jgi:hypothetical protein